MKPKKKSRPSRRVQMTIDTHDFPIPPDTFAQITEPSRRRFRPERLRITDHPREWSVTGLRIGKRLVWDGHAQGSAFAKTVLWAPLIGEVVKRGENVALLVSYRGRLKNGRPFRAVITGGAP
jgi:hypothetical protein